MVFSRPSWQAKVAVSIFAILAGVFGEAEALAVPHKRAGDPPNKIPTRAPANDLKWQPALDFDTDSCYNVAAIGCDGKLVGGLPISSDVSTCRDTDLSNVNVYSRARCNSGWCMYMYDYYFEQDYASPGVGHTHDWEHIIVWVPDSSSEKKWVCGSAHGGWDCKPEEDVRWYKDTHPKMVYHKDKAETHAFRFGNEKDDNPVENIKGDWQIGDLISWFGFPNDEVRKALVDADFGHASFALKDSNFGNTINNALPKPCTSPRPEACNLGPNKPFPHRFDPNTDSNGSPGYPDNGPTCNNGGGDDPPSNPEPTQPPSPSPGLFKTMIVGDSITQGFEGDWTWRVRLLTWLLDQNKAVEMVGPWGGTHTNAAPSDPKPPRLIGSGPAPPDAPRTDGRYAGGADYSFAHHWALWGRQAAQVKGEMRSRVAQYSPDYLLVMLGFNDLGWFVSGPEGTLESIKTIVDEARAAKSDVKILLANVVHRTLIDGREDLVTNTDRYNAMLKDAIPGWSTATSQIAYVDVNSEYSCSPTAGCPAAYDGLHPNELGELQIARAFSKALVNDFKVGSSPLNAPSTNDASLSNGKSPTPPNNLRVSSATWGIKVEWDPVFGANGYEVRSRIKGLQDWQYWGDGISWPVNRWDNSWVLDGQEWEYAVRTQMGIGRVSEWTGTASAIAHPTNPKGPGNVYTEPRGGGLYVSWDPVPGAELYEVITFDRSATGRTFPNGRGVQGTTALITDSLDAGHIQAVAVVTWVSSGPGWPSVAMNVLVGGGRPSAVSGLQVTNTDPTTVQLSWPASAQAASYRVWFRNFKNNEQFRTDDYSIATTNSHTVAFLFPGTWNFEFYVVAMNGNLTADRSNVVVPPVYPGFETK